MLEEQNPSIPSSEKTVQAQADQSSDAQQEDSFTIEEIEIEEMAIDGICGVY